MNLFFSILGTFIIVGFFVIQRKYFTDFYFSFGEIIYGFDKSISIEKALIKLGVPFLTTFIITLFYRFRLLRKI